jgi:hypothetical protein
MVPEMVISRQRFPRGCGLWERSIQVVGTNILVKLEMGFSEWGSAMTAEELD